MTATKQPISLNHRQLVHVYGSTQFPSVLEQNDDRTLTSHQLSKVTFLRFVTLKKEATLQCKKIVHQSRQLYAPL
jgi:hypothetical protein